MKAVSLYHPLDVGRTIDNIDRFMESFFYDTPSRAEAGLLARIPQVDVIEKDDSYVIDAELPGYAEKDIQVHLDGGTLTIESAKEEASEKKDEEKRYIVHERRASSFTRSFRLPENADSETITASFKDGLLSLEIKKRTEAQKRVIQIGH